MHSIIRVAAASDMTVEEQVLEKLRQLPPERQEEVLAFVDRLQNKSGHQSRNSLLGLWADLGIKVSDEDIARSRREMWGTFPRDIS
jgi:hypothetical protein